jgi:glycosyltransferase involved in cell wall biosynthesis
LSGGIKTIKNSEMLSVIIPTYNRASYLEEAIRSVLDQDHFQSSREKDLFELIIIDNDSTDDTRKIIKSFGDKVEYHFLEKRGVSRARNLGLRLSRGRFIAFLDSDDLWKRDKIRIQMRVMKNLPRTMICYTEEIWIRNGVFANPKKKHKKYSGWIFDKVLPLCLLSLSSALFKREVFDEVGLFDEDLTVCEDYDLGIRLAHRYPFHLVTKPLILKRGGHPDQLSRKYWGMDRFRIKALEKALSLNLSSKQEHLVRQEIMNKCKILISGFQKRSNLKEAGRYMKILEKYRITQEEL